MTEPLILITNDDGIASEGLWAVADALVHLGELVVVAPNRQWSGAGRSMLAATTGKHEEQVRDIKGRAVRAVAIDATPAQAAALAILEFAPRPPALFVSGINFGENMSTEVTISGTVGAALEAAAHGVPALSVSLAMSPAHHHATTASVDYAGAAYFTRLFGERLIAQALPYDVDVLNVNVPEQATPATPWRLTRLSRRRYYLPVAPDRTTGKERMGYKVMKDPSRTGCDTDIFASANERVVSVTPLSLDLTSRADFGVLEELLCATRAGTWRA
ncbi:MAG: 5'/3'-nucleotidase SurE [Anaerolineae bacterium]|nr:5'/3'-nucleotidase SurE [Anaerolineae bacterium]